MLEHADLHGVTAHFLDLPTKLAAAPIKNGESVSHAQSQDAHDMIPGTALDRQALADSQVRVDIHPGQAHVASSIPSRATVTISSISSGVITYGGMKYTTFPMGRSSNPPLQRMAVYMQPAPLLPGVRLTTRLVTNQLNRKDHAPLAHLGHVRMIFELACQCAHVFRQQPVACQHIVGSEDFQSFHSGCAAKWLPVKLWE